MHRLRHLALCTWWLLAAVPSPSVAAIVEGSVTGHDGNPMIKAHVDLFRPALRSLVASVDVATTGRFEISFDATGLLIVRLAGVGHEPVEIPVVFEGASRFRVEAKLRTYAYVDIDSLGHAGHVALVGDFARWDLRSTSFMQPDFGAYYAEFKRDEPTLSYQLANVVPGRTVNGTDAVDYVYDGGGDYRSVVPVVEGLATIVFDPSDLVRSSDPMVLRFDEPHAYAVDLIGVYAAIDDRRDRYEAAIQGAQRAGRSASEAVRGIGGDVGARKAEARAATKPALRKALYMGALQVVRMETDAPDTTFLRECLRENPPDSPYWALCGEGVGYLVKQLGGYPAQKKLLDAFVDRGPDPEVRRSSLVRAIAYAEETGREREMKAYSDRLQKEYGDSPEAAFAKQRMEESVLRRGAPLPAFSVPALEDSTRTIDNAAISGKTVLVDLWATWCGPCIREMPALHEAYEAYRDRNFEILSLSLDRAPAAIEPFRKKWPMPWLHAFLEGGFKSKVAKRFGVTSIPMPILVAPDGNVVAYGRELRGANLQATLERVLTKQP